MQAPDQDSQPHVTALNRVLGEASRVIGSLRGDEYYYDDSGGNGYYGAMHPAMLVSEACLAKMCKALNEIAMRQTVKLLHVRLYGYV